MEDRPALERAKAAGKNAARTGFQVFKAELRFVLGSFFRPFRKTLLVLGGLIFVLVVVTAFGGMSAEDRTNPVMYVVLPVFALFYTLSVVVPIAAVFGALRASWTLSGPAVLVPIITIPLALLLSFWIMSGPLGRAGLGVAEACLQVGGDRHWLLEDMGPAARAGPIALVILLPVLVIDLGAVVFSGPVLGALAWLLAVFAFAALLGLVPSGAFSFLAVSIGYVRRFRRRHAETLGRSPGSSRE